MLSKLKLLEAIQNMPEEKLADLESVLQEIILLDKIENSLVASTNGEILTEQELDELTNSW